MPFIAICTSRARSANSNGFCRVRVRAAILAAVFAETGRVAPDFVLMDASSLAKGV
jgi:hypothetical protein